MNIVVLTGGVSTERDVSISTAVGIADALRSKGHKAMLVDVFLGCPHIADYANVFDREDTFPYIIGLLGDTPVDIEAIQKMRVGSDIYFGKGVIEICKSADFVFIASHGGNCENGRIQAVFDCYGIKYSGSGYVASALAMNKVLSVQILHQSGISVAESEMLKRPCRVGIPYPVVIKAQSQGSSVGVYLAHNDAEYDEMVKEAFNHDDIVLVEKYIQGREFSVGIVGETVLPVIEIKLNGDMFDYTAKYQAGVADEICPAPISPELTQKLQKAAAKAYDALLLSGYARIDFLADEHENIFCLEANTIPGLTPNSLLPKEAAVFGWSYVYLCEKIIESSLHLKTSIDI